MKYTYLQVLNPFIEFPHPLHNLLSLIQTLAQHFDLLLDTNHPRMTIMQLIILVHNRKQILERVQVT